MILLMATAFSVMAHAQFDKYTDSFAQFFDVEVDTLILFSPLKGKQTAVAIPSRKLILVDKHRFNSLPSAAARWWVMYHELAHVELKQKHAPLGLMYYTHPEVVSQQEFYQARNALKASLKKKDRSPLPYPG